MGDVTHILSAIDDGDPNAGERLLSAIYDELRRLAAVKMAREAPDHTPLAKALIYAAWLSLVANEQPGWNSRGHFFAAAAEALRRILIDNARRKNRAKRGGGW